MSPADITYYTSQALLLVLLLSLPVILAATVVGLIIGLLQALTQIQEQSIPYGFKLVAVIVTMLLTAPWLGGELLSYTLTLFNLFPTVAP